MTIRRRFLLASSLARVIQRERGGLRQVEGFFLEQMERTSWVRLEESRADLFLRTIRPNGAVEEQTEIPLAHAHALLDVCAGEIDYIRTQLPIEGRVVLIDQVMRPDALHFVTVEFDSAEEGRDFDPLLWFGPEVTADNRFGFQALALRGVGEPPEVPLSDAALDSLLDALENRITAPRRRAMHRPTGRQVPGPKVKAAGPVQADAQGKKVDLTAIEAAMMREMERTLKKTRD
jgi:CYTH domain-containing protein